MDFTTIFNTMAFPVAGCIAMGWYVKYTTDTHRKEREEMMTAHKEAEDSIKEAIVNNTIIMTKICERLGESNDNKEWDWKSYCWISW